ncbi:glycosyl hydrolase 53 family protein [Paenibacillus pectinilyticus]|nr:glycosyl hydrolase 53 family protein [Paenibacillus pectinilyticus]
MRKKKQAQMGRQSLAIAMAGILTTGILPATLPVVSAVSATVSTTTDDIHINPIPGLASDFIKGADVSMLKQIEVSGGKFYDGNMEKDALQILKDHGVNWVRLRVWNNPVDANNIGLGGGNNDKARTIEIAKRAHDLGLKVLLDFHYSDFWADPSKQTKPAAWVGLNTTQLGQALYDYTSDVIQGLTDVGAMPEMVQIGNETNTGMVWPDGQTTGSGGYEGWANLIKKGVQAVRDNDPNNANPLLRTKIMIHLADGGNNELFRRDFDQLTSRQVDYDVIGFSYYPYWHGPLADLKQNMIDISQRYGKEVLVAENAYAYTLNDGDNFSNNFGPGQEQLGGYKATVQGQAQEVHDVMNAVSQVPNGKGLGVFYWEPDWIPVKGAEWSSKEGEGNGWENQAMFDFTGHALPSLDVFNRVSAAQGGAPFVAKATIIHPEQINVTVGGTLLLPSKVQVEFTDDSVRDLPVTWDAVAPEALQHPGTIQLQGTVTGIPLRAAGTITVQGSTNLVSNPGFESGDNANWTITGDSSVVKVVADSANAHGSTYALHYSLPQAMPFSATQTITGLANGSYTLKAWSHGGGGESSMKLFAKDYGGEEVSEDIVNAGWLVWQHPILMNIEVSNNTAVEGEAPNGTATIGVKADGNAGNWGNIDDFEFYTDRSAETLTAPSRVSRGSTFNANVGNGGLVDTIYAEDLVIHYDSNAFEFVSAQSASPTVQVLTTDSHTAGAVRLILGHQGGKSLNTNSVTLTLRAKSSTSQTEGIISVASAQWGTAPAGGVLTPAALGSATVSLYTEDTSTPSTGTGSITNKPEASIELNSDGKASLQQTPILTNGKTAVAAVTSDIWKKMMDTAKPDANGTKKLSLILSKVEGATSYEQQLPREALTGDHQQVEVVTPQGTVTLPANMLSPAVGDGSEPISLTIGNVDLSQIPAALQAKIGSKPVLDLKLKAGNEVIPWHNAASPVTISIPYQPTADELQNPDHIVIWYIDENGQAVAVPNAKYDAATHSVVFTTTHFSTYAVAYVSTTFGDLIGFDWAKQAVEALASKGVTTGTSADSFSPALNVSRADYLVMLVKALGLTANAGPRFQDVAASDYYDEAVGIAKALGLAEGVDAQHFDPKAPISREDLMVLTARALQLSHRLNGNGETSNLNTFAEQSDIAAYAKASISALLQAGLVQGNGYGLAPKAHTTRAEAAVILYRLLHF